MQSKIWQQLFLKKGDFTTVFHTFSQPWKHSPVSWHRTSDAGQRTHTYNHCCVPGGSHDPLLRPSNKPDSLNDRMARDSLNRRKLRTTCSEMTQNRHLEQERQRYQTHAPHKGLLLDLGRTNFEGVNKSFPALGEQCSPPLQSQRRAKRCPKMPLWSCGQHDSALKAHRTLFLPTKGGWQKPGQGTGVHSITVLASETPRPQGILSRPMQRERERESGHGLILPSHLLKETGVLSLFSFCMYGNVPRGNLLHVGLIPPYLDNLLVLIYRQKNLSLRENPRSAQPSQANLLISVGLSHKACSTSPARGTLPLFNPASLLRLFIPALTRREREGGWGRSRPPAREGREERRKGGKEGKKGGREGRKERTERRKERRTVEREGKKGGREGKKDSLEGRKEGRDIEREGRKEGRKEGQLKGKERREGGRKGRKGGRKEGQLKGKERREGGRKGRKGGRKEGQLKGKERREGGREGRKLEKLFQDNMSLKFSVVENSAGGPEEDLDGMMLLMLLLFPRRVQTERVTAPYVPDFISRRNFSPQR
ncbi:hypothetical protein L345_14865, partial [Ophiophagus hannah]